MSEVSLNLKDIEKKVPLQLQTKKTQKGNLTPEKPKTSQKKGESLRKTFYNFNNILKVDDFKFLTQKNFHQAQGQPLDERKRNLLVQAFRNNVATFMILRKYKGMPPESFLQKNPQTKSKKKREKFANFDIDLLNNSKLNDKNNNLRTSQEIGKINLEIKVAFFEENSLKQSEKLLISSDHLQSVFMNKFTSCLDLSKLEESEDILNNLTLIYENFLRDLSSKVLKVELDSKKLVFVGFIEEKSEEAKENPVLGCLKVQKDAIIKEILEEELEKLVPEIKKSKSEEALPDEKDAFQPTTLKTEEKFEPLGKRESIETTKPNYMEMVLGLREPEPGDKNINHENIIDQLLNAKDLFDVDLDFMRPNVIYPDTPELQFKNDDEKKIFNEIHKWLFEIEAELEDENRAILEYKKTKFWDDPQEIFQNDFPEADDDDDDEETEKEEENKAEGKTNNEKQK